MKIAGCLAMIAIMLFMPRETTQAARTALSIWGMDVVPSLFPYMVFCRMLSSRLSQCGVPAAPATAILGLMGGSPSAASVLSGYARQRAMPRRQVLALAALTGTISPMFLLNTVEAWVNDARFCRLLLFSHLFGALFSCVVVLLMTKPGQTVGPVRAERSQGAADPIADSVSGVLGVGGCIVFFSVLSAGICALLPQGLQGFSPFLHAALEIAGGMHNLSSSSLSPWLCGVMMAGMSAFSGLSMITQNLLFLRPLGVSLGQLLLFALLRMIGASVMMGACLALL